MGRSDGFPHFPPVWREPPPYYVFIQIDTWASTSMYLRDTWGQWLPLPRRRSRLPRSCRPCSRPRCCRPCSRPCSRPSNSRQCSRSTSWTSLSDMSRRWQSWRRVVAVHTVHSAALVLYYLNTDQRAWYCVLYVFLFIIYNTVFCIVQPWARCYTNSDVCFCFIWIAGPPSREACESCASPTTLAVSSDAKPNLWRE